MQIVDDVCFAPYVSAIPPEGIDVILDILGWFYGTFLDFFLLL